MLSGVGALLIPQQQAREILEPPITLRTLAQVKGRWGISIRALVRRCLDLHSINDSQRVSLEKQISNRGWHKQESVEVRYGQPVLVKRLIEIGTGRTGAASIAILGPPPLATRDLVA